MELEDLDLEKELEKSSQSDHLKKFLELIKKSSGPCPDGDCKELVCPCGGSFSIEFGTLPLEVVCKDCGKKFLLRSLV